MPSVSGKFTCMLLSILSGSATCTCTLYVIVWFHLGEASFSFWRLFAILLLVALCCLACAFAIVIIAMCVFGKSKVAHQGEIYSR